jgi:hypothetical protein
MRVRYVLTLATVALLAAPTIAAAQQMADFWLTILAGLSAHCHGCKRPTA